MEIIQFDSDQFTGVICPKTGIKIDFSDEDICDYLDKTFVLGVFLTIHPSECAIGGVLNDAWINHCEAHEDDYLCVDELLEVFPGPYKAIEVCAGGMACGPVDDTAYYVVPEDSELVWF